MVRLSTTYGLAVVVLVHSLMDLFSRLTASVRSNRYTGTRTPATRPSRIGLAATSGEAQACTASEVRVRSPEPHQYLRRTVTDTDHAAGHFTTKDKVQVFAAPIVVKSDDFTTPAPMIVWTAPDDPRAADQDEGQGWEESVAFPDTFRLVHEIAGACVMHISYAFPMN